MNKTKILILEHDLNDLELLLHSLKKSDLNYVTMVVETREDYEKALNDFIPDIILSDFSLPAFDGLSAYKLKQDICPSTPFIIVSGTIGDENAVDLIKMGITDYTLKEKMYQVPTKVQRALKEAVAHAKEQFAKQELAEQAELTQNILESITDGFATVDHNWVVKYWNKQAEQVFGMKRADIIDNNFWDVYLESVSVNLFTACHAVMNERTPASFEEFYHPFKIWLHFSIYPSKDGISLIFKDITEAKRIESITNLEKEVLEHYTRQGTTIESTSRILMNGIRQMHPEILCTLMKATNNKLYNWAFSDLPESFLAAIDGTSIAAGGGCAGTAAFLKEKVISTDIANDPLWKKYQEVALKNNLKACVAYPCIDPYRNILGVFCAYLKSPRALSAAEALTVERAKYIFQNIVENHIAEETIKLSEEKYRDLYHLHPLPLWLYDTHTLNILDVNAAAVRHYGYSREEFLAMSIKDIRPKEDLHLLEKAISASDSPGDYLSATYRHKKKNGELIHVDVKSKEVDFNGNKARLILSMDITEKFKAEHALKISENRFKALVQEGSDLINIIDLDGIYKYATPASAAMMGLKMEEVAGTNAFEFIHEDDREMIAGLLSEIKTNKRIETPAFRFKDQNGEYRWLQSVGTNLLDDPAVEGIVVNSKDITESVNYIRAIEEQNAKLKDIAWMQSHIVRAPLSRIMGLIDLIDNYPESEIVNTELLHHILTSAHELDNIIREIVRKTDQVDDL